MSCLFCLREIGKVPVEYLYMWGVEDSYMPSSCVQMILLFTSTVAIQNICVLNFFLKLLHVSLEKETKLLISLQ